MSNESWVVVGIAAALWFVREIIPVLAKVIRNGRLKNNQTSAALPQNPTAADGSGAYPALPNEQLATRRELEALETDLKDLRGEVRDALKELTTKVDNVAGLVNQIVGELRARNTKSKNVAASRR